MNRRVEMPSGNALKRTPAAVCIADHSIEPTRRDMLVAPFCRALPPRAARREGACWSDRSGRDGDHAFRRHRVECLSGGPPHSGEVATLYGGLDTPGPYLVLMKWNPGYMSAPHSYATDRLSAGSVGHMVVNSGADFDPTMPCRFRRRLHTARVARTPHYDGVRRGAKEPAVIALFGIAPVKFELVDPSRPAWRQI